MQSGLEQGELGGNKELVGKLSLQHRSAKKEADSGDYGSRSRKIREPAEHRDRIEVKDDNPVLSLNDLEGWGGGSVQHNVEPRRRAGLEAL